MFTLVRNFFSRVRDGADALPFETLDLGYELQFGIMPQASLSVRRFRIVAVHSYVFGEEHFTSFSMAQEQGPGANLIIAGEGEGRYLALSRKISTEEFTLLFDEWRIDGILHAPAQQRLQTKVPEAILRGWIAPAYRKVIGALPGSLYRGRHFDSNETDAEGNSYHIRDFTYNLLVSDDRSHALEIEEYDDGKLDVYVTVFRPADDITRIDAPVRRLGESRLRALVTPYPIDHADEEEREEEHEAHAESFEELLAEQPMEETSPEVAKVGLSEEMHVETAAVVAEVSEPLVEENAVQSEQEAVIEPVAESAAEIEQAVAAEIAAEKSSEESLTDGSVVIQPGPPSVEVARVLQQHVLTVGPKVQPETIACNARIAQRLIDEALRNQMSLEVVVRKVLGLSSEGNDQVLFNVNLSDDDYTLLAERYEMPADDRDAIKKRMVEELAWFAGDRR